MEQTRELEMGTLRLRDDGILHARFDLGTEPSPDTAKEYLAARDELCGARSVPVIVEIVRIPFVERTLRGVFMSGMHPPLCRAVVTTDTTYRSMFKSFEILDEPRIPTEFFPTVDAAVVWISELLSTD
jgi:hypothetical protein